MKYGSLFEDKEVKDLTHEVLTHHGMRASTEGNHYGHLGGSEPQDIGALHSDLASIGWRKRWTDRLPIENEETYIDRTVRHTLVHPKHSHNLVHHVYHTTRLPDEDDGDEEPYDEHSHTMSYADKRLP